jgi:hypothetical protein
MLDLKLDAQSYCSLDGGETFVGKSLVAFDTDHIKEYVFGTDKLKEIRGASSLLDRLNRREMVEVAKNPGIQATLIYANGGAGLFVVDSNRAQEFKLRVQQMYSERTKGRATVTGVIQELPHDAPDDIHALMRYNLKHQLDLMRYHLRAEKDSPPDIIALPSHPFMRPCNSCGINYAEHEQHNPGEQNTFYCASCLEKQAEDGRIKSRISETVRRIIKGERVKEEYVWDRILRYLKEADYTFPSDLEGLDRPNDFNEFHQFVEAKDYLGLIYADANNMGVESEKQDTLQKLGDFAVQVDEAIHQAMCRAINRYLPIVKIDRDGKSVPIFPFDILLVGGDDIVMVTDAAQAMNVALTIAQEFRSLTKNKYSLAVGVVIAPIKYPFGLLQDMVESTMKFAKTGAQTGQQVGKDSDDTRINFLTVTGGSEPEFIDIYQELYRKIGKDKKTEFYATLRPYKPEDLQLLLNVLATGGELNLGRTKLHQLREAVLQKNLTTSVKDGLNALLNWRVQQRSYVVQQIYEFGHRYEMPRSDPSDPLAGFPRITFPWFADGTSKEGRNIYRTSLLDFIELYDFVPREEDDSNARR